MGQFRHVLRGLRRSPMFTIVTLLTIGLAVGANSAIFSVINGVLLKPLPYPEPERLVSVRLSAPAIGLPDMELSPSDYFTFREESRTFEEFGMWGGGSVSITGVSAPEQVRIINATERTLAALRVQPVLGRGFTATDDLDGSPPTAILMHGYWERRFGGEASAVGKRILVDGRSTEIIGVMPRSFRFLDESPSLILPFQYDRGKAHLGNFSFNGIARLKPGFQLAQANADVTRMLPIVMTKFPPPPGFSIKLFEDAHIQAALRPLKQDVIGTLAKVLWVLMGSIGVVLLIACANVANLLLVRAEGRHQELAIRAALGAGSRQLAGTLMLESLVLGMVGGAAGLGLAYGAQRLLVKLAPSGLPRLENIVIDAPVVLFTLAISLGAGLIFGLIPVVKYASPRITAALRAGGRTLSQSREAHRTRNALVVLQMALALVLLIGSGLMIRTFQALRKVDPGFRDGGRLQTVRLYIPDAQVKDTKRALMMMEDIRQKMAAIPGVTSTAFANSVPTDGNNSTDIMYAEDKVYREGQIPPLRRYKFVAPGFFQTMGTRIVAGRDLTWTDLNDERLVTMVSESLARELWQTPEAALGKRVREGMKDPWREIIGVVADVHLDGADKKPPATTYWPILMKDFWDNKKFLQRGVVFVMRSERAGTESFLKEIQQAVWSVNSSLPLARVRTVEEIFRESMARSSFTLVMLAVAGGMALLIGIVGIYGVISYSVSQRTREIGIRLALGAQQTTLQGMVVRHGLLLAAIGVALGLLGAVGETRVLASFLYGIGPMDPVTYVVVSVVLVGAAALASYVPAHRPSNVNPVDALRAE